LTTVPDPSRVYYLLVLLRLALVFVSFGYIHPDSFFQSPEVVAGELFGFDVEKTWEFEGPQPCRSIVPAFVMTGLPFLLLKALSFVVPFIINSYTLYIVPRLFLFFTSFIVDYTAWRLSGKSTRTLITAGGSWAVLVMLLQPFSNTTETLTLAVLSFVVFRAKVKSPLDYLLMGIITSWGIFNRFTFVFYVFPIALFALYEFLDDTDGKQSVGWQTALIASTLGFVSTSLLFVFIDSIYFGVLTATFDGTPFKWMDLLNIRFYLGFLTGSVSVSGGATITPLNSFRYNLNEENLAKHGLSPRISHLLFHVPALFGPLAVIGLLPYYQWLDDQLGVLLNQVPKKRVAPNKRSKPTAAKPKVVHAASSAPKLPGTETPVETKKVKQSIIKIVMVGVCCSSTLFLSLSPHQEMRFLLPNIFPLILLGSAGTWGLYGKNKKDDKEKEDKDPYQIYWTISFILFNIVLLIIMGFFHQGGVVQSLMSFQFTTQQTGGTNHLVYYHTYMPPRHLLAQPKTSSGGHPLFSVHDLMGAEIGDLRKTILRIKESVNFSPSKDKIYLLSPATVPLPGFLNTSTANGIGGHFEKVSTFWPHLSLENPPKADDWFTKLTLLAYLYHPSQ